MNYELDNIYCADCYEAIKDIPDHSVDLIVTDPPYLIENTKAGGNSELAHSIQHMNDELQDGRFTESVRGGGTLTTACKGDESYQPVCVV